MTPMNTNSSRRDLLATSAVVTSALVAHSALAQDASPAAPAPAGKKRAWKKAVMDNMLPRNLSWMDKCKLLKDTGFHGVELHAPGGPKPEEWKEASAATGITCAGVVDSTHWRVPLSLPTQGERDIAVRDLFQAIRDCKSYGGTSVLLVPAVVNEKVSNLDAWTRSIDGIRKAIPVCEETGVKIAVENVWNQFIFTPTEAKAYLDAINSPWVGWHFDIGNMVVYGPPEYWPPVLGKHILKLHIKEYSRRLGREDRGKGFSAELMEGDVNWAAVMKALDDNAYTGNWATLEVGGGDLERFKFLSDRFDKILAS